MIPLLLALVGCESEPALETCAGLDYVPNVQSRPLSLFPMLSPSVDVSMGNLQSVTPDRRGTVELGLAWGTEAAHGLRIPLRDGDEASCPVLATSFSARIGGLGPAEIFEGGWGCIPVGGPACAVPKLVFSIPPDLHDAPVDLVFGDSSLSQTVPLGDALVERSATPASGTWAFSRGQAISLDWIPASDLTRLAVTKIEFYTGTTYQFGIESAITRTADSIDFQLPDRTFTGTITISLSGSIDGVSLSQAVSHDIIIN
jgi:hypothetical protein